MTCLRSHSKSVMYFNNCLHFHHRVTLWSCTARIYCHQKYTFVYKHVKLTYMSTNGGWSNPSICPSHSFPPNCFYYYFSGASFNPAYFPTACAQPHKYPCWRKDQCQYQRTDTSCWNWKEEQTTALGGSKLAEVILQPRKAPVRDLPLSVLPILWQTPQSLPLFYKR